VKNTQDKGRVCIADRDIKAGEVVLSEPAYAWIPNDSFIKKVCHQCFKVFTKTFPVGGGIKCNKCQQVIYCSEDCKNTGAVIHTLECNVLPHVSKIANRNSVDMTMLRLVIRMLCSRLVE